MRVALDSRSMQLLPLAGVGRVTARVLPHLLQRADIELLTALDRPPLADFGVPTHALTTPWPHVATAWLQWSAPRWLSGFDGVFHCPWYALPFRQPVPMVASLHDLTFEHHPEWFTRGRRLSYTVQARWAARTAGALLTGSQAVADDIMATYDVPASRITVTAYPVDETFGPGRDGSAALERLGATPPYIVAMGGSPRRRLDVALDAWRAVRTEHQVDLVVVGTDDIPREAGVSGGWLEDDEWAGVLAGAEALVYPTEYEGFGFPALEAIASGTPVVCARVGSLPEVLGDAAAWCGVADAEGTARELTRLLTTPAWAEELRAAGLARAAACPSWSEVADGFMEAYQRAAGS